MGAGGQKKLSEQAALATKGPRASAGVDADMRHIPAIQPYGQLGIAGARELGPVAGVLDLSGMYE